VDDWAGDICPDCSDDLKDFLFSHDTAAN